MPEWLERALSILIGDHRHYSIERRLFNTISLLNAITKTTSVVRLLPYSTQRLVIF